MLHLEAAYILLPAIVVGVMILCTHIPLGQEVLKRGIIFIDLAIAQAVGLGLVIAELLHVEHGLIKEMFAVLSAIMTALVFRKIEKTMPQYQEALIGVFYVMAATLSLLVLSHHPHGAAHFNSLLSGEMLFVSWQDILIHLPIYIGGLLLWFKYSDAKKGLLFYLLFAVLITSSVQLVGIFMVFIALIVPALMMSIAEIRLRMGYVVAIVAMIIGLSVSLATDYPSSSCVIISITGCSAGYAFIKKKYLAL